MPTLEHRRRAATLLLALASTIVSVLALELGARALRLHTGYFLGLSRGDCLRRSALLEWEFRPGCTARLESAALRINAAGLRGPEIRDDGSTRVLALGDSSTFGWNVTPEETYPAALERLLNRRAGDARHQVLNAGVAGYRANQGLVYLPVRDTPQRPFPDTLAAVGAELDVPLVVYDGPRLDLVHPTPEGYRRLGADIVAALERKGYLSRDHDAGASTR